MSVKEEVNSVVAFLSGDLLATVFLLWGIPFDFLHPILHAISILVLGAIGGFGGLLGKSIYTRLEKLFENLYNKWKK